MSLLPMENSPADLFSFAGSVGRFGDNNREDVIKAQALLANAGYYELPDPGMPTGWPGGELNRALTRFQKDHGLEPDGILLPLGEGGVTQNGMGETLLTLQDKLGGSLKGFAPPSVQEVDHFYRARPMLDGNGKPMTNVYLRSADGSSRREPIGLKPSQVTSDEPPEHFTPKAGDQTALLAPAVQIGVRVAPQIPNLLRGLGILAPAATLSLSGDSQTPAAKPDLDAQRPPEPAQPKEDRQQQGFARPQRGRIIISEDGKELHVPPLGTWADELSPEKRQIAEGLNDAFTTEMALHTGGSRGNALTQEGVNIAIKECFAAAQEIFPDAGITHVFGGNLEGDVSEKSLKEEHLWHYDEEGEKVRSGSRRPDFGILVARSVVEMVRGNTFDSDGKGKPVDRESTARDDIGKKTEGEQMAMFEKQGRHMTAEEFRRNAREICRDAMEKLRDDWERRGELQKPPSKTSRDYPGPASAQRAQKLRDSGKPLP